MRRIIIDGNSIGFAAHQGTRLNAGGQQTQAIFGMIKTIHKVQREKRDAKITVLWDGRSWRHTATDGYKATRSDDPKKVAERNEYKRQRPHIARGLKLLGVDQVIAFNLEADDLAPLLVDRFSQQGDLITLLTGDKDWLQLVKPGVVWQDHKQDRKCTHADFQMFTGYENVRQFVQGKALQGDTSDNIPGVGGIGEKGAQDFMMCFGSVECFMNETKDYLTKVYCEKTGAKKFPKKFQDHFDNLLEFKKRYEHNMMLMDLHSPLIPKPQKLTVNKGELDIPGFEIFCGEFGFHTIRRDVKNFTEPFLPLE